MVDGVAKSRLGGKKKKNGKRFDNGPGADVRRRPSRTEVKRLRRAGTAGIPVPARSRAPAVLFGHGTSTRAFRARRLAENVTEAGVLGKRFYGYTRLDDRVGTYDGGDVI